MPDPQAESTRNQLFAERLATIEASNDHQRQSLSQISKTLERVVETQAKLANQHESITTLAREMSELRSLTAEQETAIRILSMKQDKALDEFEKYKAKTNDLENRLDKNESFLKQLKWTLTIVLTPVLIYVGEKLIGLIS